MSVRMGEKSSEIPGFHKLSIKERLSVLKDFSDLDDTEMASLMKTGSLSIDLADRLIENVVSTLELPVGIVPNFLINGKDYLIPMAIEEASVIAACSNAAKIARASGGFTSESSDPVMIGQIQIMVYGNYEEVKRTILDHRSSILEIANSRSKTLSSMGAGAKDIEIRKLNDRRSSIVIHLLVDVRDAMGANVVNSMCESVAPYIEEIAQCKTNLRILSNLTPYRISRSKATFRKELIGGEEIVERIISAYEMANVDPYRAATHNKGIMNGIDAVLLATLNDWRSAEANAHTYHELTGNLSLTSYHKDSDGNLVGEIEIPIAVGIVGGSTNTVKKASIFRKILNISNSMEFANILAATGLAQNFSAIRALSAEGIQKGHMALHARSLAASVGASGSEIDQIAGIMVSTNSISMTKAKELLDEVRKRTNK